MQFSHEVFVCFLCSCFVSWVRFNDYDDCNGNDRSVVISSGPREPQLATVRSVLPKPQRVGFDSYGSDALIDKDAYFGGGKSDQNETKCVLGQLTEPDENQKSNWTPLNLRPVPAFYPLEKSSRFVDDDLDVVASRISECLRILSVQAIYHNEAATANLMTSENLEMHLSLWKTSGLEREQSDGIVVELQRRKGCSITFHRYSRHILDAALGDFDLPDFVRRNGQEIDRAYSRKVERLISIDKEIGNEHENAIIAIEIAHGLLMKDRMDARQLGLESLCLLTDPRKTGNKTSVIASRVVLLGSAQATDEDDEEGLVFDESPFQEIRETVLSLVQLNKIGDEDEFSDDDVVGNSDDSDDEGIANKYPEEQEHLSLLHNLALAVLANALDVMENYDAYDTEPEDTGKKMPASRGRADTSDSIAKTFMEDAKDFSKLEILSSLIQELGKATNKPHNACLSAKCLRSLCGASADARRRAKDLGAKNVVSTALDVGVRTHAKLETECKKVVKVLTATNEEDL